MRGLAAADAAHCLQKWRKLTPHEPAHACCPVSARLEGLSMAGPPPNLSRECFQPAVVRNGYGITLAADSTVADGSRVAWL